MGELSKTLGTVSGTALMLNTVLGAGVLTLPGLAAAQVGEQALWTWIACAAATIPLLVVFTVLSSRYPEAGGVGHIAKLAFGSYGQVITSALFLGAVFLGLPSIALTAGYYVASVADAPPTAVAVALVLCAGMMNLAMPGTASKIGTWIAAAVLAFLLILVVASLGVLATNGALAAGTPNETSAYIPVPNAALLVPFMLVFFAFTGWEVAIGASEEFQEPRRTIPRAVAASFAITIIFYIVCSLIVVRAGEPAFGNAPFLAILAPDPSRWTGALIAIGTVVLLTANLFAAIWAVSRMVFSLARERLLPTILSRVEQGTPRAAVTTVCAIIAGVAALDGMGIVDVDVLFAMAGQNFLIIYASSAGALIVLAQGAVDRVVGVIALATALVLIGWTGLNLLYPLILVLMGLCALLWRDRRYRFGKEVDANQS